MVSYSRHSGARSRFGRRLLLVFVILAALTVAGAAYVRDQYQDNLRPVSASDQEINVIIRRGESVSDIAAALKSENLIRSPQAFEWYVSSHNIRDELQAGTYTFMPSMSTPKIAQMIANGEVATDLVTILPGKTLADIEDALIDVGFKSPAVEQALTADQYRADFPALADNPKSSNLEGFLYPETYQLTASTEPRQIVEQALRQMQQHLTSEIRKGFAEQGLTVYQGVTLASIVQVEVPGQSDRRQVAQVFLSRLEQGIPLGADATENYAEAINNNLYNTYDHKGLPPGPIATVTEDAMLAVANPADTSWLFFVSGDNGKTYFSQTLEQHQSNIDRYCRQTCTKR